MTINDNVRQILAEVPPHVSVVAAAKGREPAAILEAIGAGIRIIGENYVQEAERAITAIGRGVAWHCIGHLQKNKVSKAVVLFDLIETVDSRGLAIEIDRRCRLIGKVMPVLIEVNSGREPNKSGVYPEQVEQLLREIAPLENIRVMGLMTMGPLLSRPEDLRPFFRETKDLFEHLSRLNLARVEMRYLSMGMSDSYRIAIEEGANIIRLGTRIFGRL